MTEIVKAAVLPNGWLSVQVSHTGATPDAFRVSIDGADTVVPVEAETGFEAFGGHYYLPRIAQVTDGATITATALDGAGEDIGAESAPVVATVKIYSPERMLRHLVADCLTAAEIEFEEHVAWVHRDRMGWPTVIDGRVGKPGALIEVGVVYMSGDDTFADSTQSDTQMTVPVRVMVKGDKPDRGQDAVDLAYRVREYLAVGFDSGGFGIVGWQWSGSEPEQVQNGWVVSMQMSLTRISVRGVCGVE